MRTNEFKTNRDTESDEDESMNQSVNKNKNKIYLTEKKKSRGTSKPLARPHYYLTTKLLKVPPQIIPC